MVLASAIAFLASRAAEGGRITVFAAASLKDAFTTIARDYEASHPGSTISLSFAGSQTLSAQINQGAPADVFASAAIKNLNDTPYDKSSFRIFAHNRLIIVLRKGLRGVRQPRDLARVQHFVIADQRVPVGSYTQVFFEKAARIYGVTWLQTVQSHVVSREQDVKAVLAKVRLGEADAGVVYASDAASAKGQVEAIPIPDNLNTIAEYPVATPNGAPNKAGAKEFEKFLFTSASQRTLEANGFISPLRAVSSLPVVSPFSSLLFKLPLTKLKQLTVKAKDHSGNDASYRGVSVEPLIHRGNATTATFWAADGYSQTLSIPVLIAAKAVLVQSSDGNYQLIVPGLKPNTWVHWIRRIELR